MSIFLFDSKKVLTIQWEVLVLAGRLPSYRRQVKVLKAQSLGGEVAFVEPHRIAAIYGVGVHYNPEKHFAWTAVERRNYDFWDCDEVNERLRCEAAASLPTQRVLHM